MRRIPNPRERALRSAVAVLVAAVAPIAALAQPAGEKLQLAPMFVKMISQRENAALTMSCVGDPPFRTLTCEFTQVSVRGADKDKLAREQREIAPEVEKLRSKPKEYAEMVQKFRSLCATSEEQIRTRLDKMKGQLVGRTERAIEGLHDVRAACRCGDDLRCILETMARNEQRSPTCTVSTMQFGPITFDRRALRKWVAKHEAPGCPGLVTIIVLEHEESSVYQWTMTQTRTGVPGKGRICESLDLNIPLVFSWKFDEPAKVDCSAVKFGF